MKEKPEAFVHLGATKKGPIGDLPCTKDEAGAISTAARLLRPAINPATSPGQFCSKKKKKLLTDRIG